MKVLGHQIREASGARICHFLMVPYETKLEELLDPSAWMHIAKDRLHKYDRIEVAVEGGAWFADLMVVEVNAKYAKVIVRGFVDMEAEAAAIAAPAEDFYIKFGQDTPNSQYRVFRSHDKQIMKAGFLSKQLAQDWINDYQAKQNAVAKQNAAANKPEMAA